MSVSDQIYLALGATFAVLVVTVNLVYQKFVILQVLPSYTFEVSIAALLYPFTFLISDLLAEFYGSKKAHFCVNVALCLNIIIAWLVWGMDHLPATSWSKIDNDTFHLVFGHTVSASLISVFAAYISQRLDISIYLFIRKKTGLLGLSNFGSTAISMFIDTCIVVIILDLFALIPSDQTWLIIYNHYLFKICAALCNVPVYYGIFHVLKNGYSVPYSAVD